MDSKTDQTQAGGVASGWKVRRVGPVTFAISKPKRKAHKLRQSRIKNRRRSR